MKNVLIVAAREFRQIAAMRSFWLTLLILPIALALGPLAQRFLRDDDADRVMIIDRTGGSAERAIAARFDDRSRPRGAAAPCPATSSATSSNGPTRRRPWAQPRPLVQRRRCRPLSRRRRRRAARSARSAASSRTKVPTSRRRQPHYRVGPCSADSLPRLSADAASARRSRR